MIEVLKQALEAFRKAMQGNLAFDEAMEAFKKIEQAIKELESQETVAWRTFDGEGQYEYRAYEENESYADDWNKRNPNHKGWVEPLYTHPPQRTWQGLTDEEIKTICSENGWDNSWQSLRFAQVIEAKLKEKNCAG